MALSANELRIGNYVNTSERDGRHFQICRQGLIRTINNASCNITPQGCSSPVITIKLKNIEGIPLTEEWFLKFGAEKDKYGDLCIIDPTGINTAFYLVEGFIQWTKDCVSPIANFEHVKYVHQFQNLYFIKTNKELEIINTDK